MKPVMIPGLKGPPVCLTPFGYAPVYVSSQPIMSLKELEPDFFRWEQWKMYLQRGKKRKKPAS